jgi:hypothetical protein
LLRFSERQTTYYAAADGSMHSAIWARTPGGSNLIQPDFCESLSLVVPSGRSVTLTNNAVTHCDNFSIEVGGTLTLGGAANPRLRLQGDWINDGTLVQSAGRIQFYGSRHQVIDGGTQSFQRAEVKNALGVSIQATQVSITGELKMAEGTLTTNGALVIASSPSGTGCISEINASADISGRVTIQRYHNAAATGWFMLAAPVSGATVAQWNDDLITTGFPGSDYPATAFNNIRYYDESMGGTFDVGYFGVGSNTTVLDPLSGYFIYAFAGAHNIDVFGNIQKFNQNIPVYFTNNGMGSSDGWNLISNPYPCNIDWTANSGAWTKTNIANEVYVFNAATGTYATYVNGVSANGGSPLIASSQAFFVRATAANPALQIKENAKTTSLATFKSNEEGLLATIFAGKENKSDELIIGLLEGAFGYDPGYDAVKLINPVGSISIAAQGDVNELLAIDHIGSTQTSIPLYLNIPETGKWNFNVSLNNGSAHTIEAVLEDLTTGEKHQVNNSNSKVMFEAGVFQDRYILHLNVQPKATISNNEVAANTFSWIQGEQINIQYAGEYAYNGTVDVYNSIGQIIYSSQLILNGCEQFMLPVSRGKGQLTIQLRNAVDGEVQNLKLIH